MSGALSRQAIKRLPDYLQYLRKAAAEGREYITATAIAEATRLNEVQVRKDISAISSHSGKPMVGFPVPELIQDIETYLGNEAGQKAVLVGAGSLGRALMGYGGFAPYGLHIAASFDLRPADALVGGIPVLPMSKLEETCRELDARIGIIAIPPEAAQSVCDRLVACGVKAIWNFAPTFLKAPGDVLIHNELLASSAAVMVRQLQEMENKP